MFRWRMWLAGILLYAGVVLVSRADGWEPLGLFCLLFVVPLAVDQARRETGEK